LNLYIDYLKEQIAAAIDIDINPKRKKQLDEFEKNLIDGINYYRTKINTIFSKNLSFSADLDFAEDELRNVKSLAL
jgi:hypothetical protein